MSEVAKTDRDAIVKIAADAADDKSAQDILILDIAKQSNITDFFLICSGSSTRQTKAIAEEIQKKLKENDERPFKVAGVDQGEWILLDYSDLVIHIFTQEMREYYELERLWKDAPMVKFDSQKEEASAAD